MLGRPRIVPAGPRILKAKDKRGRWLDEKVVGYVRQPYLSVYTDSGWINVDPRIVYLN